jgi:PST family polysaccharide transporter
LWATSVVGGATFGALLIGLIRNKAVALIGGPSAVGLLGLFASVVSMAASFAMFGLNTSAVRELAPHRPDVSEAARVRRAIWTMAWPLAVAGAITLWFTRNTVAELSIGSTAYAAAVGWLAVGVAATVIGECQLAVLQAYGRLTDLARVRLWGSAAATLVGVGAVYRLGLPGIVVAVVAIPVMPALFAAWVGRDLPSSEWRRTAAEPLSDHWRSLATIGGMVMITSAIGSLTQLSIRALITHELGLDSAGFFHAASSIMSVNLSLVLNAMAADYYPRVSIVADDTKAVSSILNQQLHVALMLAGPALAATSLAAPVVLKVLYSDAFADSSFLLRLLIAAATLRLPVWALGFVMLARRSSVAFCLGELTSATVIPLTWLLVPMAGLDGAGFAVLVASLVSFVFYETQVRRSHNVSIDRRNLRLLGFLWLFLSAVAVLWQVSAVAGMLVAALGTAGVSWHSYHNLRSAIVR